MMIGWKLTKNVNYILIITIIMLIICTCFAASNAYALEGKDMGKPVAQIVGGYSAHYIGNMFGNWMLDLSDDFPTSSLSSLSVVATSFVISIGTSATVYGIGQAFDDDSRSFGWTMLGGISAVGISTFIGTLIGLDDWKSGAAIGSVVGRYMVPIYAIAFYYMRDSHDSDEGKRRLAPAMTIRF